MEAIAVFAEVKKELGKTIEDGTSTAHEIHKKKPRRIRADD